MSYPADYVSRVRTDLIEMLRKKVPTQNDNALILNDLKTDLDHNNHEITPAVFDALLYRLNNPYFIEFNRELIKKIASAKLTHNYQIAAIAKSYGLRSRKFIRTIRRGKIVKNKSRKSKKSRKIKKSKKSKKALKKFVKAVLRKK